jgi:hypothetical protein
VTEDLKNGPWTEENVLDVALLAKKISAGADVHRRVLNSRIFSWYPLGLAACVGNLDACRLLLDAGANPNVVHPPRGSPLVWLIQNLAVTRRGGQPAMSVDTMRRVFEVLVEYGANLDGNPEPDNSIKAFASPLLVAALDKQYEAVNELVRVGADINRECLWDVRNGEDLAPQTALDAVRERARMGRRAEIGDEKMMLTLLRLGGIEKNAPNGFTLFHESVAIGRNDLVEYYVKERGEDLAQRVGGKTLLQIAKLPSTRALLRSLKTGLAIQSTMVDMVAGPQVEKVVQTTLDSENEVGEKIARPKRAGRMEPL